METGFPKEEDVVATMLVKFAPYRDYLEENVVRHLVNGLLHLLIERPPNALSYLGDYLIEHDPLRPEGEVPAPPPPPEDEKKEPFCEHCAHSPPPPPPPPPPPAEGEAPPAEAPPA